MGGSGQDHDASLSNLVWALIWALIGFAAFVAAMIWAPWWGKAALLYLGVADTQILSHVRETRERLKAFQRETATRHTDASH